MTSVTAYLSVDGADAAIDFYVRAFGAEEHYRLDMPDGSVGHAEIRDRRHDGDARRRVPRHGHPRAREARGGPTASFSIEVDDLTALDAMWDERSPPARRWSRQRSDQFYGYRSGTVADPFGHRWAIMTKIEDVSPEEMRRRMAAMDDTPA